MIYREATKVDYREFFGKEPEDTIRAKVWIKDGELKGIGGYTISKGYALVFTDYKGDVTKREVIMGARVVIEMILERNIPVITFVGPHGDTALRHFGFEPWHGPYWRLSGGMK